MKSLTVFIVALILCFSVTGRTKYPHWIEFDSPSVPENFDHSDRHDRIFVSSNGQGPLWTLETDGTSSRFGEDIPIGAPQTFGVTVDGERDRVLVVVSTVPESPTASHYLVSYKLGGRDVGAATVVDVSSLVPQSLPSDFGTAISDSISDDEGNIYIVNAGSTAGVWKIDINGELSIWSRSDLYAPVQAESIQTLFPSGLGCIDIERPPFATYFIVAKYGSLGEAKLFRVDLNNPNEPKEVQLNGQISVPDGLALDNRGDLWIAGWTNYYRLRSDDDWNSATVIETIDIPSEFKLCIAVSNVEGVIYGLCNGYFSPVTARTAHNLNLFFISPNIFFISSLFPSL